MLAFPQSSSCGGFGHSPSLCSQGMQLKNVHSEAITASSADSLRPRPLAYHLPPENPGLSDGQSVSFLWALTL